MRSSAGILIRFVRKTQQLGAVLLFCLILVVTSSFAWGTVRGALNEWFGSASKHAMVLQKYERDVLGHETTTPIHGARFTLFRIDFDADEPEREMRTQVGGYYTTDIEGRIEVKDIPVGRYVFVEVDPAFGYGLDTDPARGVPITDYPVTIPNPHKTASGVDVVVYNQVLEAPLTISKTVRNPGDIALTPAQLQQVFTYTFLIDSDASISNPDLTSSYPIAVVDTLQAGNPQLWTGVIRSGEMFTLLHGQSALIEGIPIGTFYRIVEAPVFGYARSSQNSQGTLAVEGARAAFTNTHRFDEVGSLIVRKSISGSESDPDDEFVFELTFEVADGSRFDPGVLTFTRTDTQDTTVAPSVETTATIHTPPNTYQTTFTIKAHERIVFENLPLYLTYSLREIDANGYLTDTSEVSGTIIHPFGDTIAVNNHKGQPLDRDWTLDLTKHLWDVSKDKTADELKGFEFTIRVCETDASPGYTRGAVTYEILRDGEAYVMGIVPADTGEITVSVRAGDRIVVSGEDTEPLLFEIIETDYRAEDYYGSPQTRRGTVLGGQNLTFDWYNIYRPIVDAEPAFLRVTKTLEGDCPNPLQPFTFELTFEGADPLVFTLVGGETKTFETTIGTEYSIRELLDPSTGFMLVDVVNAEGTVTVDLVIEGVRFTNAYRLPMTITIEGEKVWDLVGVSAVLPASIEVLLIDAATDTIVARQIVTAANGWLFSFRNVDKYDAAGVEIRYTVAETEIPRFTSSVEALEDDYFILTNTLTVPVAATTPYVGKTIKPSTAPHAIFSFTLEPLNGAPMPAGTVKGKKVITITGQGTAQFGTIVFDRPGTYHYLVKELSGTAKGYTYDTKVYELIYVVEEVTSDSKTILVPSSTLKLNSGDQEVEYAAFENTYKKPADSPDDTKKPDGGTSTLLPTGDSVNIVLGIIILLISGHIIVFADSRRGASCKKGGK